MGKFIQKAAIWIDANPNRREISLLQDAITSDDRLRHQKIKKIRLIICPILDNHKPWEVVVGQAIGTLKESDLESPNMLISFLGAEMVKDIIFRKDL